MGATKEQRRSSGRTKEAVNRWCGFVTELALVKSACGPLPFDLRLIETDYWESKWYSRNNRRLQCFRKAAVIAVQVRVGSTERVFFA